MTAAAVARCMMSIQDVLTINGACSTKSRFSGDCKRPGLFWEKKWGGIGQYNYREHIVPLIDGYMKNYPALRLMQDHAPGHNAKSILKDFKARDILLIPWPVFSPDLNPIETLWNVMKDWIQENYVMKDLSNYKTLRKAVNEAWESIGRTQLDELLNSMHARCEAVIAANGMATKC